MPASEVFKVPKLPGHTYHQLKRICADHGLTQWQTLAMLIGMAGSLPPGDLAPWAERARRELKAPR